MVKLARAEEEILQAILEHFVTNNENVVKVSYDVFPAYALNNIQHYLEILKYNSLISSYYQTLSTVEMYLTPDGIKYFQNKKKSIFPKSAMD